MDTDLFDRRITVAIDTIEITSLDFEFKIEKTLKPEPNTCDLTIYNLTEEHQAQLEQIGDAKPGQPATKGIGCSIDAGYASGTSRIWLGDLRTVQTTYENASWVTRLTSGDGAKAWKNARLHVSFGPKTSMDTALRAIVRALGVGEGNLSKVVAKLKQNGSALYPTGVVLSGSASRMLTDFAKSADLDVSIQDGALQFLDRGKAVAGQAIRLAPETGLIGSPTVDNKGVLTADVLMTPNLIPGRVVSVEGQRVKGAYRAEKCTYEGDTSGEDWTIRVEGKRY